MADEGGSVLNEETDHNEKSNTEKAKNVDTAPMSPDKSEKSLEVTPTTSSTTPTAESYPFDDLPHDMVSSYTEISFGGGDSDLDLLDECIEMNEEVDLGKVSISIL